MKITLADDSVINFNTPMTIQEIATTIAAALGRPVIGAIVNDKFYVSISCVIERDCKIQFITDKNPLEKRIAAYTAAIIFSQAFKRVFGRDRRPVSLQHKMDGTFSIIYDFHPFSRMDLDLVKAEINNILKENLRMRNTGRTADEDEYVNTYVIKASKVYAHKYLVERKESRYLQFTTFAVHQSTLLPTFTFYEELSKVKRIEILTTESFYFDGDEKQYQIIHGVAATDPAYVEEFLTKWYESNP